MSGSQLSIGQPLRENLVIRSLLGKGGMGAVYLAENKYMPEMKSAVKMLAEELTNDLDFRERFFQEAKRQSSLMHENIVPVKDYFEEANRYFLVMAYIEGETLSARIKRKGKLDTQEAIGLFKDVLKALDCAHQKAIIHRDVKPSNVLIDNAGRAWLTDFGIAIQRGAAVGSGKAGVAGTAVYMSPEQVRDLDIDHRSDVYSAGIMLFEMLTGDVPFGGTASGDAEAPDSVIQEQHVKRKPPNPRSLNPDLSPGLARTVLKALEKNPDKRFQGCADFLNAFEHPPRPPILPWVLAGLAVAGAVAALVVGSRALDEAAAASMANGAAATYAVICRDSSDVQKKQKAKEIAKRAGQQQYVDAFQKQIDGLQQNGRDNVARYQSSALELSKYCPEVVADVLARDPNAKNSGFFFDLLGEDVKRIRDGESITQTTIIAHCPAQ